MLAQVITCPFPIIEPVTNPSTLFYLWNVTLTIVVVIVNFLGTDFIHLTLSPRLGPSALDIAYVLIDIQPTATAGTSFTAYFRTSISTLQNYIIIGYYEVTIHIVANGMLLVLLHRFTSQRLESVKQTHVNTRIGIY